MENTRFLSKYGLLSDLPYSAIDSPLLMVKFASINFKVPVCQPRIAAHFYIPTYSSHYLQISTLILLVSYVNENPSFNFNNVIFMLFVLSLLFVIRIVLLLCIIVIFIGLDVYPCSFCKLLNKQMVFLLGFLHKFL